MNVEQATGAGDLEAGGRSLRPLVLLIAAILVIFVGRTAMAATAAAPRLFDLFNALTMLGLLPVLAGAARRLRRSDWLVALGLGALVGGGMLFATLFSPYPIFGVLRGHGAQALARGVGVGRTGDGGAQLRPL